MLLTAMMATVRAKFPGATQMSTSELEKRLAGGDEVVLVDTREKLEFQVSHLPGAVHVDPNAPREELVAAVQRAVDVRAADSDAQSSLDVVCYCSVGWRSSKVVEAIQTELQKPASCQSMQVYNLEGSCFKWANEGRCLVDGSGEHDVSYAHPYDSTFGSMLERERWRFPDGDQSQNRGQGCRIS
mmetsp:Transcript_39506/g.82897  ORF Transcript_39506/g.82897 Transcript_39506/m.82897 type:complete len:185 (+) Transcript_39506:149-703(+)|eukprot:6186246-Pleurochrysis_carterae.AAC.2